MITVQAQIKAPLEKVWEAWTTPEEIMKWNAASDDWHTPRAENDLRPGGTFLSRMEAKDGSIGFDFKGTYTNVIPHELIEYHMEDGRKVSIRFTEEDEGVKLMESFDPETINSEEMQRSGWQSILDRFKSHVESMINS